MMVTVSLSLPGSTGVELGVRKGAIDMAVELGELAFDVVCGQQHFQRSAPAAIVPWGRATRRQARADLTLRKDRLLAASESDVVGERELAFDSCRSLPFPRGCRAVSCSRGAHPVLSIRHLVMPNHVECCTYPVLDWIAQRVPAAPVNVMAQFHPDNFCDPESGKYREKYADIGRRPLSVELDHSWGRAHDLGLHFETVTFERSHAFTTRSTLEM